MRQLTIAKTAVQTSRRARAHGRHNRVAIPTGGSISSAAGPSIPSIPVTVAIAVALMLGTVACHSGALSSVPAVSHYSSNLSLSPPASSTGASARAEQGLVVPASYQEACADEASVCRPGAAGPIPAVLKRPLHFPILKPGERCPATHGSQVNSPTFAGIALGNGPVRALIGMAGNLRAGITDLAHASPWLAFKTDWFSFPSYRGPFVIRAEPLGRSAPVAMGESPVVAPLVMPPGQSVNGSGGWRDAPGYTWVTAPGCYAWQVDGLSFSEVIVVQAVLPALPPGGDWRAMKTNLRQRRVVSVGIQKAEV